MPNAASPSVINNLNSAENIIRSWGGNRLVMTDMDRDKKVLLSTPEERCLELYDGKKLIRLKSESCELLFDDREQYTEIDAGGHRIRVDYICFLTLRSYPYRSIEMSVRIYICLILPMVISWYVKKVLDGRNHEFNGNQSDMHDDKRWRV